MQQAIDASPRSWKEQFVAEVELWAKVGLPFTSEDITEEIGLPDGNVGLHRNNAVGAMMNAMAKRGVIEKTGKHVSSKNPESHGAELTQWVGK